MMEKTKPEELDLETLSVLKVLGKGAMGTVLLVNDQVNDPSARCPFALKVVEKSSFQTKHEADRRARWEVTVLSHLSHPFLPNLLGTSESNDFLAWAIPYCPGGDLNVLRQRQTDRTFSTSVIRFYVSQIVCALEYLHRINIVYRDLKPENILIQSSGHVTLTDFDLSRNLKPKPSNPTINSPEPNTNSPESRRGHRRSLTNFVSKGWPVLRKSKSARVSPVNRKRPSLYYSNGERSNSFVGTAEYVSPEVVRGDGHEFAVDWWALGILIYEMMYGKTPFRGKNRKETFRNVIMKQPEFIGKRSSLTDLIERLLEKDPTKRLGYDKGAVEIKDHEFFQGLRWDLLTEVSRPPFLTLTEEEENIRKVTSSHMNVREYFNNLKLQQSISQTPIYSPLNSPLQDGRVDVSFTEF